MGTAKMKALEVDGRSGWTMGRWSWLVFFALAVFLPRNSAASATDIRMGRVSRLRVEGGPRVTLTSEVSCPRDPDACEATFHWTIPSADQPRNAVLLLAMGQVRTVELDGRPLEVRINEDGGNQPVRLDLVLPASQEPLELEIAASVGLQYMGPRCGFGISYELAEQRHRLQSRVAFDVDLDAELPVSPYDERNLHRAHDPPVVEYAEPPEVSFSVPRAWKVSRKGWSTRRTGSVQVATPREAGKLFLAAENRRVVHGAVVGIGARLRGKDARPWLRGGWEFSVAPRMLHTLAVESDLRRITVVPSTEIGTGGWFILPALSAGVGVPVRVHPELRPGARVWGGLNYPIVGIVGGYDVFPAVGRAPIEHVGHIGLQFSI